jgi:hypothetical protein
MEKKKLNNLDTRVIHAFKFGIFLTVLESKYTRYYNFHFFNGNKLGRSTLGDTYRLV